MRGRTSFIAKRALQNVRKRGTDVLLKWVEHSGATTTDPLTGSTLGTVVNKEKTVKALVHFVQISETQVRQFQEIQDGDCIADFEADVAIEGLKDLRFVIDGTTYVQKEAGQALAQTWDVVWHGRRIFRTVLLRKAT